MSHFTKLDKADVTDTKAFVTALKELGFKGKVTENTTIRDYSNSIEKVDVAISTGKYGIALQKNANGKFDMVSDWWGVLREMTGEQKSLVGANQGGGLTTESMLQDAILQGTTKHALLNEYGKQGFMGQTSVDDKGNVHVTLTR